MGAFNDELVFIVDDDEPVRDSMKVLLEACRLRVRDYASCRDFIDDFDGEEGCLLLDLHLPVMSGLEFLEKYGDQLGKMPVIMVTGRGDPETFARARKMGVSAILEKPFEDEALLDTIRQLLPNAAPGAAGGGTGLGSHHGHV
ncbi:response regulator transcription factor [Arenibaculum pallidiluteum]|uniref:response regulator transcription factor n=1 Tax=Arenibaculum pallidiluteum TaxID=2812559 RepID=UPI002E27C241|nr:response regulator [Arenibaculum pallidiluteum]